MALLLTCELFALSLAILVLLLLLVAILLPVLLALLLSVLLALLLPSAVVLFAGACRGLRQPTAAQRPVTGRLWVICTACSSSCVCSSSNWSLASSRSRFSFRLKIVAKVMKA